jgi:hypothetical protein
MIFMKAFRKKHIVHQWEKKVSPTILDDVGILFRFHYYRLSFEVHFLFLY